MNASVQSFIIRAGAVRFERDPKGAVWMVRDETRTPVSSVVAAFPLSHRESMVSVRDSEGEEIGILDDLHSLDDPSRAVVEYELDRTYFMPRIIDIIEIDEALNVVEWFVETNKGPRRFQAHSVQKNVRRIGHRRLVIKDVDGNRYEVQDWTVLPPAAQALLEPYLLG
jgi:hypothetical protein